MTIVKRKTLDSLVNVGLIFTSEVFMWGSMSAEKAGSREFWYTLLDFLSKK